MQGEYGDFVRSLLQAQAQGSVASIEPKSLTDRTGQQFTIRTAQPDDAETLLAYIRPVAVLTKRYVYLPFSASSNRPLFVSFSTISSAFM